MENSSKVAYASRMAVIDAPLASLILMLRPEGLFPKVQG